MPAAVAEAPHARFEALGLADAVWSHPERGLRASAFGEAERREGGSLREVLSGLDGPADLPWMPGPWFGAAAFDGRLGEGWAGFSPLRFTLPLLLAWTDGARHQVAAFGEGARARLDHARRVLDGEVNGVHMPEGEVNVVHMRDGEVNGVHLRPGGARLARQPGERERWEALVARALDAISAGTLDKVVVARALEVEADADLDPAAVLRALEASYPACRSFLLRGAGGASFVGATPEVLCRIDGDRIETEALAGSSPPDRAEALLGSRKDLREHSQVVDHLVRALSGVAHSLQHKPEPGLRSLANVAHLHTPISARLSPGRGVADAAAALHPTPAVGGVPSQAALRFLDEHEGLDRGLYAGLIGWVGPGRAELAVALRSAVLRGGHARLFVGAGIVEGSSAAAEWAETELKARALLDALGVPR
jgi:isochorismate synthase